ncbi:hypothetical protein B0T17DRAFT_506367 [Bombardia bombarda]|uniref:Uncharacterized protein n=1 Tax=Bombardia bombarda TaxID=252184 RepID=A0AA39X9K6_9PEZI|nr:hypothetical protein B0T17DRAFT_506367 [Bombardia bombarda]
MPDNDGESPQNPFVRFKQHIDARVGAGIQSLLGLPSVVSRNFSVDRMETGKTPSTPVALPAENRERNIYDDNTNVDQDDVETRLDQLRGGSYQDHLAAWDLFATRSAYSPLRLSQELGWAPTPNGLPAHFDPDMFDWTDAFEDLLAASSAKPMMSLAWRYMLNQQRRHLMGMDMGAGADPARLWLDRLDHQGLTEVYFPHQDARHRYRSPQTMGEWVEARRREAARAEYAGVLGWDMSGPREFPRSLEHPEDGRDRREDGGGLFPELNRALKVLGRVLEDEVGSLLSGAHSGGEEEKEEKQRETSDSSSSVVPYGADKDPDFDRTLKILSMVFEDEIPSLLFGQGQKKERTRSLQEVDADGSEQQQQDKLQSQTEEELYSVIQSAFHESERSLSTFMKTFAEGKWRDDDQTRVTKPIPGQWTGDAKFGETKTVTKEEFVDESGNVHLKTEVIKKNAEGRETSRQTHYSVRHVSSTGTSSPEEVKETTTDSIAPKEVVPRYDDEKEQKKAGWFWK